MNNLYYNDKKLKQIKSKRTQKRKRVWGWILTVLGALELPAAIAALDASALISPLIFLIPGIILLLTAKKKVDTWDRYEAIIDNMGNTPISLIAKKMGFSEPRVYSDLQEMIHSDFFIGPNCNIEAYVDAEHDMLVMASGGKPLRPIPDLPKEAPKPEVKPEPKEEAKTEPAPKKEQKLTPVEMIQKAIGTVIKGRTSFVIAHRLSTIIDADVILVVNRQTLRRRSGRRSGPVRAHWRILKRISSSGIRWMRRSISKR